MAEATTCSAEPACPEPVHNKKRQLCRAHYRRWQRYDDPLGGGPRQRKARASGCVVIEDGNVCGEPCVGHDMCRKHYMRNRRNGDPLVVHPRRPPQVLGPDRTCTRCGATKPTEDFPWRARPATGGRCRHSWCSACVRGYQRTYIAANPRQVKASKAAYYHANKERAAAWNRAYRELNRERYRETAKRWREANPDKHRASIQRWQRAHPAKVRGYALRHYYRKLENWVEDVDRATRFVRDNGICGICGLPVDPDEWELDHIHPVSKGGEHSYANTQVSHPSCNSVKCDRLLPLPRAVIAALRSAHQHLAVGAA